MPPESGGVLFVHAHPDDECVGTGGLIARLVAEGVRVDLVTCTDGAEGEIHDPDLDHDVARPRLAEIRRAELDCSVEALGDGAIRQHLLGYRDSGMMGTDANEHPGSFWKADLADAAERLIPIVRDARPSAIITYDENGNYGHPDHINAHRIARAAYDAIDGVDRFYEIAFHREAWGALIGEIRERGIPFPWEGSGEDDESSDDEWGTPDALVTTRIDVAASVDRKRRSMECHRTQRQDMGWLLDLPADLGARALSTEYFILRNRRSAPFREGYREEWLL